MFIKESIDKIFGNQKIKKLLRKLFGFRYFKFFIHISRYRACHMVDPGDNCILAGIFSEDTVKDFTSQVGNAGKVIVVEANKKNVERLKSRVAHPNLYYVNCAVYGKSGTSKFIASRGDEQGYNRLKNGEMQPFPYHIDADPQEITVKLATLDNITMKLGVKRIHHINLTINGAEYQALDGISEVIKKNRNLRIYTNSEFPNPGKKVIEKLQKMGFEVYTSRLIRTINKRIKLRRIYAVHNNTPLEK